jgi:hypothetical protein
VASSRFEAWPFMEASFSRVDKGRRWFLSARPAFSGKMLRHASLHEIISLRIKSLCSILDTTGRILTGGNRIASFMSANGQKKLRNAN